MSESKPTTPDDFFDPLEDYEPPEYEHPMQEALVEEKVPAIEHKPFITIPPTTTVEEAMKIMTEKEIGCLMVEECNTLVGVISDRDLLDHVGLEYAELKDNPVTDVMTADPCYLLETQSTAAALCVMAVSGYRHVPVLNVDNEIVGIVSPQRVTAWLQKYYD